MEGTVAGSRKRLLGGCGGALLVALFYGSAAPAQDSPADIEQLRQSARAGDAQALFSLADRYERGKSVEQDLSMTAALMRLAALRGHPEAQYRLGLALVGGVGVGMDLAQGYRWLTLAIAGGGDGRVGLIARPLRDAIAPLMTEPQIAQAKQGVAGFKAMAGPAMIPKPAELFGSSRVPADRPTIERLRHIVGTTNCGPTRITRSNTGTLRVEGFIQGRRRDQAIGSAAAAYIKQYAIAVNFTE
ncbi:MAG: tetratricopeptide repeat protein, partial [Proteobacteria bacterium]|nr:tetratricopeptide repeat protein [Pseudomonadota bacterium]